MKRASFAPRAQLFVCTNLRAADDPLASGCGAAGPRVFAALKRAVAAQGEVAAVWVTATRCLGHCPRRGCAVVVEPAGAQLVEVEAEDAPELLRLAAPR